jgi:adenine specific DNA methylase Mod
MVKRGFGISDAEADCIIGANHKSKQQKGDIILDPFCGCGTTVDAANKLEREWIGIDITYLALMLYLID